MLILTRKPGETTDIFVDGRTIEVTVLQVKGDQVRLSFTADQDVIINRREITDRIGVKRVKAKHSETKEGDE